MAECIVPAEDRRVSSNLVKVADGCGKRCVTSSTAQRISKEGKFVGAILALRIALTDGQKVSHKAAHQSFGKAKAQSKVQRSRAEE